MNKTCKFCKKTKPMDQFITILYHTKKCCKNCYESPLLKKQREKDQRAIQKRKEWLYDYERHGRKWNIASILYRSARNRAKTQGIPFSIKREHVSIPEFCPVLGLKLKNGRGPMCENSPTIDRICPRQGYIVGNVCVISSRANRLKSNATIEELKKIIGYMEGHARLDF